MCGVELAHRETGNLFIYFFLWTIMLCVCHTTPTHNGPLSGWATTTGRLLGPKMALGVYQGIRRTTASISDAVVRRMS